MTGQAREEEEEVNPIYNIRSSVVFPGMTLGVLTCSLRS